MKEELKKFLIENDGDYWYGCDSESMCQLIDRFFDQYQPERSKREDLRVKSLEDPYLPDSSGSYGKHIRLS
jgi:hypothetical protein